MQPLRWSLNNYPLCSISNPASRLRTHYWPMSKSLCICLYLLIRNFDWDLFIYSVHVLGWNGQMIDTEKCSVRVPFCFVNLCFSSSSYFAIWCRCCCCWLGGDVTEERLTNLRKTWGLWDCGGELAGEPRPHVPRGPVWWYSSYWCCLSALLSGMRVPPGCSSPTQVHVCLPCPRHMQLYGHLSSKIPRGHSRFTSQY